MAASATPAGDTASSPKGFLSDVSCPSTTFCEAVGAVETSPYPGLAEMWNGSNWTRQTVPKPAQSTGGPGLYGVSCVSSTDCVAVGFYQPSTAGSGESRPVVEMWNGSVWKVQATPEPGGSDGQGAFSGVSCVTADSCEAVGYYFSPPSAEDPRTLVEAWNGTTWTQQPTPHPSFPHSQAGGSQLFNVSCSAGDACAATGFYSTSTTDTEALALTWNGSSWRRELISEPASKDTEMEGVWCSSADDCEGVGFTASVGFAYRWNGATWTRQSLADPGATGPETVACSAGQACEAVGSGTVVAEGWNGSTWTKQSAPNPDGGALLSGVSCPSTTFCEAVGFYGNFQVLIERWNGTTWVQQ
jgi:hypothetical protein